MKPENKTKACIGGGVLLFVVSVLLIILGVFVTDVVDDMINDAVESGLKLSPGDEADNSSSWDDWVNTDKFYEYHVFNYTNVDAMFLNGERPEVEEVGPYTYQEFNQNYNISFEQDDRIISYNKWWYKVHQGLAGEPSPAGDMLTNMNPIYWGLASQVWALVKSNLYSAFNATAADPSLYANPNANFPFGLLGPLTIPANHLGAFTPPVDVTVPKTDSIVGKFAGQLVLATLGSQFEAGLPPQMQQLLFPATFRALAEALQNDTGVVNPVSNLISVTSIDEGNTGFKGATAAWVNSTEVPAEQYSLFEDFAYFTICPSFEVNDDCPFAQALAAEHGSTDLAVLQGHAEALADPFATLGLFNVAQFQTVWGAAIAQAGAGVFTEAPFTTLAAEFGANVVGAVVAWAGARLVATAHEAHSVEGFYLTAVDTGVIKGYDGLVGDGAFLANPTDASKPTLNAVQPNVEPLVNAVFDGTVLVGGARPATWVQLAYLQFAKLTVLGDTVKVVDGISVKTTSPGVQRGGDRYYGPEFSAFIQGRANDSDLDSGLAWDQAQRWISPSHPQSLANETIYGAYLLDILVSPNKEGAVLSQNLGGADVDILYGLNNVSYDDFEEYITKYVVFHELIFANMIDKNFGPFYEVSMESLLLGTQADTNGSGAAPAELKALLQPLNDGLAAEGKPELNPDNPGLVTTYRDANDHFERTNQGRYALLTGAGGNLKHVRQYYQYRGFSSFTKLPALTGDQVEQAKDPAALFAVSLCQYSELNGTDPSCAAWRSEEYLYREEADGSIFASSTGNNFAPFNEGEDPTDRVLKVWIAEGQRVIDAHYDEDVTLQGIKVQRFIAPASVVKHAADEDDPNYKYRMDATPTGVVPMDLVARGLPAAVTRPHFWQSDAKQVFNKIGGLKIEPEKHFTYIDVEPLTGATMRGAKRFMNTLRADPVRNDWAYFSQLWNYIPEDDDVDEDSETSGKFIYFPWYWGTERGEIEPDDAKDFREGVYDNRDLAEVLSVVFLVVGITLAAASAICLVYYCRQKDDAKQERVPSQVNLATNAT